MKKKITIKIADDLTPKQEAMEISKMLTQKLLAGNGNQVDKLRIGDQIDIKHLETEILIQRIGATPIEMITCNVCGHDYQSNLYKGVWTNYGGKTKEVKTCSDECAQSLISICGEGRASLKKKKLTPVRFY